LPDSPRSLALAKSLRATRSHRTAAQHWGFALPPGAEGTDLTIPNKAQRRSVPDDVSMFYRDLDEDEVVDGVTSPLRTVVDCLRDGTLREALSVGDSALRQGTVDFGELSRAVSRLRGRWSARTRKRLHLLDARAANAFESSCRAILLDEGVDTFTPQVSIRGSEGWIGRVDLADRRFRIVIECDGYETHGGRDAFVRDLVRFTSLVAAGWRPLRFTWEQVMFSPDWVLQRVRDTIAEVAREEVTVRRRRARVPTAA
jgi:very-short-patch-repair endonuclease